MKYSAAFLHLSIVTLLSCVAEVACHFHQTKRDRRESVDNSHLYQGPRARLNKIIIPSSCHPPLLCRSRHPSLVTPSPSPTSSDPILSSYAKQLRPRPRVVKMVPIKTIRLKYQRQGRKVTQPSPQKGQLYKYKAKFSMKNILHRSRNGRLNIINASNSNNI